MADEGRRAVPIGIGRVEDPRKVVAVGRSRQSVGHRQNRDFVDRGFGDELQREAGRIGVDDDRIVVLDRVVTLDAFVGVVAGLTLLDDEPLAANAAVALVEHGEVIRHAVGNGDARAGERTGTVGEQRNEYPVRRRRCCGDCDWRRGCHRKAERKMFQVHGHFLLLTRGRRSHGVLCCPRSRWRERGNFSPVAPVRNRSVTAKLLRANGCALRCRTAQ